MMAVQMSNVSSNPTSQDSTIPTDMISLVAEAHYHKQKVVLVTGVFDLLHQEHKNFLQKAKAEGDVLVVGVESDVRVRQMKGPDRPIHNQTTRVKAIMELESNGRPLADAVFVLPEDFSKSEHYLHLLQQLRPAILAVSSHSPHLESKRNLMAKIGGEVVVVHQQNPDISTSIILQKMQS